MIKILVNQTSASIDLDIGLTVPASGQLTLNPQDYDEASSSDDIITEVGAGNLVVNDGNQNLTKADGIRLIQGGFSNKIQLDDDLLLSDRIKVDVTGTLSDGRIKVSSNDGISGFLQDKITVGSNKLTKVTNNEGSDETLQIDIDSQQINTADLNNDAGFITSGQAPVQPSDISDFETTTELNTRDTDNRNRSNHTGTQLASTISDFSTAVTLAETTTSLSFNNSNNILTFVNEDNVTTNIDLSLYLDDTNLARITSGTLDSGSGIATFTRDDSSTFTLDLSSLNDQAFINAAIDTHEQTISNHDDVDTVTVTPTSGDLLRYDGTNWVPYQDFKDFASFESPRGNQLDSFQNYLTLTTNIPEAGNYKISWYFTWSINTTSDDFLSRIEVDNSITVMEQVQEAKDSAGTGITVVNLSGGTFNSSTNQRYINSGSQIVNLTSGTSNIELDFRGSFANLEPVIYRAILMIERF